MNGTAVAYLNRDRLHHMDMLEVLRRGSGEVLGVSEAGVLIHDTISGAYMLTAEREGLAELIPAGADLCVTHQDWYLPALRARLGLYGGLVCHQVAWTGAEPPEPSAFPGEIRPLDQSYAERVRILYDHAHADAPYVAAAIERGMLGAFLDGEFAGFIGTQDEGTMGMLFVLPAFRRRGVAEALHRAMARSLLARGGYALGQVEVWNEASLALQRKVGMELADGLIYWVF